MPAMTGGRISVIIPTLNEAGNIGKLIDSLQVIPGLEIIVSDGGSTDHTPAEIRRRGVIFVRSEPGRGRQLNAGVRAASGDIFLFLHADSCLGAGAIPRIRELIEQGGHWGCCRLRFNEDSWFFRILAYASDRRALSLSMCYGDQGIFCSRPFFARAGGFPEWTLLEDLEFSRRARRLAKAQVLQEWIMTSTRRFRTYGLWRTFWKMQGVKVLFALGVSLTSIERFYYGGRSKKNDNRNHRDDEGSTAGQDEKPVTAENQSG